MWEEDSYPNTQQDERGQSPRSDHKDAQSVVESDERDNTRSL